MEGPRHGLQPEGLHGVVVVEIADDVSRGPGQSHVARPSHTSVRQRDGDYPLVAGREPLEQLGGLVIAPVVDHDELPVPVLLGDDRLDGSGEELLPVERREHDADLQVVLHPRAAHPSGYPVDEGQVGRMLDPSVDLRNRDHRDRHRVEAFLDLVDPRSVRGFDVSNMRLQRRLPRLDHRQPGVDGRLGRLDGRLGRLDGRLGRLDRRQPGTDGRLGRLDRRQAARLDVQGQNFAGPGDGRLASSTGSGHLADEAQLVADAPNHVAKAHIAPCPGP